MLLTQTPLYRIFLSNKNSCSQLKIHGVTQSAKMIHHNLNTITDLLQTTKVERFKRSKFYCKKMRNMHHFRAKDISRAFLYKQDFYSATTSSTWNKLNRYVIALLVQVASNLMEFRRLANSAPLRDCTSIWQQTRFTTAVQCMFELRFCETRSNLLYAIWD